MFNNNKFESLVTNVFSKIDSYIVKNEIDSIFSDISNIDNTLKYRGKFNDTYLFKTFCSGNSLKEIKNFNNIITNNTNKRPIEKDYKNKNTSVDKLKVVFKNKSENQKDLIKDSKLKKNNDEKSLGIFDKPSYILDSIVEEHSYISIICNKKKGDYLSIAFFSSISGIFNIASDVQKNDILKNIKLEMITKFVKENYYRNYDYSVKYFKKSDADEVFTNNNPVTVKMLKIYGDILNVNIVHIKDNIIEFITKFNPNNATVLINEVNNNVYTLLSSNQFIRGDILKDILGIEKKHSETELLKYKLDKLQNIAKMKFIDIRKAGKTGKINVTKTELIELICKN